MPAYTNAKQRIPDLFRKIMVNHAELAAAKAEKVIDWTRARTLVILKRSYRAEAEVALRWNTNKGNAV